MWLYSNVVVRYVAGHYRRYHYLTLQSKRLTLILNNKNKEHEKLQNIKLTHDV